MRRNWQEAPIVVLPVYQPRCPGCDCGDFIHWRGLPNGDATSTELVICSRCSEAFKILRKFSPIRENDFDDLG